MPDSRAVSPRRQRVAEFEWAEPRASRWDEARWADGPGWADAWRAEDPPAGRSAEDGARAAEAGRPVAGGRSEQAGGGGVPGRRTVTISGRGAEGYVARRAARYATPARGATRSSARADSAARGSARSGTVARSSTAARRRPPRPYERPGFKPDRAAMWAVVLCMLLLVAAVASAHGAVLPAHP